MTLALSLALFLLAGAVVVLFAMLGELTARLPVLGVGYRDPAVSELPDARIGERPGVWPPQLEDAVGGNAPAMLLVLSSACKSCEDVAAQLREEARTAEPAGRLAVVVSCADRAAGEAFIARHGLDRDWQCWIDEEGVWSRTVFGVQTSPTALVLRDERLQSALVFTDLAAVRAAAAKRKQVTTKETVKA